MVEKQASLEIAQSRDILRQRCRIVEAEVAAAKRYTDGVEIIAKFAEEIERDTRERCAQEIRTVGKHSHPGRFTCDGDFPCETCKLAERIRGKE